MKSIDRRLFDDANERNNRRLAVEIMKRLQYDPFTNEIIKFIETKTPDIRSMLLWLSRRYKPLWYCEIGVRKGFSMAMVAAGNPTVNIVACDVWKEGYAKGQQGSPEFVRDEMATMGHAGKLVFLNGRSQIELPRFLDKCATMFDLALVDGDHTTAGALKDLETLIPRMAMNSHIVVDDLHDECVMAAWMAVQRDYPDLVYQSAGKVGVIYGFA